nr:hypothetical protein [Nitrosomonas nitrosa]
MILQNNLFRITCGRTKNSRSKRVWSRVISAFALTALASTFVACGAGLVGQGGAKIAQDQIKATGRALLAENQVEAAGYGLYSYVLFGSRPTAETKPIYLAVILAYLNEFQDLEGLGQKYRLESLNAMYIPVTGDTANLKAPLPNQTERTRLKSWAEELLQQYDYDRAQAILRKLSQTQKNGGPYLVSSLAPFSRSSGTSAYFFQDLSIVRLVSSPNRQTQKVSELVLDFVDRVSSPRTWDRTTLDQFSEKTLDSWQTAFAQNERPVDRSELMRYASVNTINFPLSQGSTKRTIFFTAWKAQIDDGGLAFVTTLD